MGTVNVIQQPNCSDGTAIIQANANEGYQFVQWNDGSTENPHTITVTEDTTFIATFASVTSFPETEIPVISIYPNPANDILNITSPENISSVEIVNVVGQVVISEETNGNSASCNIEKLESGLYFVKIHSDSQTEHIHKFIKE